MLIMQIVLQPFRHRQITRFSKLKRLRNCRENKVGIVNGSERNKMNAIWKITQQFAGGLQSQACFTHTARSAQIPFTSPSRPINEVSGTNEVAARPFNPPILCSGSLNSDDSDDSSIVIGSEGFAPHKPGHSQGDVLVPSLF